MIFEQHYRVKWHDTDLNRTVRPTQILMYMQETANRQMRENGMDLDQVRDERGIGFLLSRISVRIFQQIYAHDEIDVQTWVCAGTGRSFNRCFRILRGGEIIAQGFSMWALLEIATQKLLRQEDFSYPFTPEEPLTADPPLRFRMPAPADMEIAGTRRIVYSDVDYNGHMNNTRYPDMLCDFIPDMSDRRITGFSLSYLHEAALGKDLTVYRLQDGSSYLFRTADSSGTTCLEARMETAEQKHSSEKNVSSEESLSLIQ